MTRIEGWEPRLEQYLCDSINKNFVWGSFDCVMFAGEWFYILTGIDVLKDIRGKYKTKEEAEALISESGGLISGINKILPKRKAGFEQRGDLALCKIGELETLGIVGGSGFVFFKTEKKGVVAKRVKPLYVWGCD